VRLGGAVQPDQRDVARPNLGDICARVQRPLTLTLVDVPQLTMLDAALLMR